MRFYNYSDFMEQGFQTKAFLGILKNVNVVQLDYWGDVVGEQIILTFSIEGVFGMASQQSEFEYGFKIYYGNDGRRTFFSKIIKDVWFVNPDAEGVDLQSLIGELFLVGLRDNISSKTGIVFTNIEFCFPITNPFYNKLMEFEFDSNQHGNE